MPTLQVLRHAQAQPYAANDRERRLTADGVAAARVVGRAIAATGVPDRVLVSVAQRARETLDVAMAAGGWDAEAVVVEALYGGGPDTALEVLADAHDAAAAAVLIVGHEPMCSALVGTLTGAQLRMRTATLASMEVGPGWDALDPSWCSLTSFLPVRLVQRLADGDSPQ